MVKELNKYYVFDSEQDFLGYKHRELFNNKENMEVEGFGDNFKLKNKTVGSFMALDGFCHPIDSDEMITVKSSENKHKLSNIFLKN